MQQRKSSHYLSQFYIANDNSTSGMRKVDLMARAIFPTVGMRSFATTQIRIVGVNENGAVLQSGTNIPLPDHFYVALGENEIFLTCARDGSDGEQISVTFSGKEDARFIDALAAIQNPLQTLLRLGDHCHAAIRSRLTKNQNRKTISPKTRHQ